MSPLTRAILPVVAVAAFVGPPAVVHASGFSHGVAAGDLTDTSVILWTRADAPGEIRLEVGADESFAAIVWSTVATAGDENDLTVKVDVEGLSPGTDYFYRFVRSDDETAASRTGRFRTAPAPDVPAALRFIFSGDSNFAFTPLVSLAHAAREDAEVFIWFGDVIYADLPGGELGTVSDLAGYRAKYKQIHSDPYVQDLLALMPTWVGWDDHEVFNDYAGLDPALPAEQRDAAYQAFFEFMPIARQNLPGDPFRTYRRLRYGSTIEFFFLDERQYREVSALDECGVNPDPLGFLIDPLADARCQELLSAPRSMLGPEQLDWLKAGLSQSSAAVKFVVNNVPMTYIALFPYDRWDGYDAERREILEYIDANRIKGVVFLTTDTHANTHNPDVTRYFRRYRPDYRLSNHVPIPELIAGPIGTNTLAGELFNVVSSFLGQLRNPLTDFALNAVLDQVVMRLEEINGLAFIEDDRMSYAVVEVAPEGVVDVTFRGMLPDQCQDPEAQIETLYSSPVLPVPAPPCLVWPVMALGGATHFLRRTRRGYA